MRRTKDVRRKEKRQPLMLSYANITVRKSVIIFAISHQSISLAIIRIPTEEGDIIELYNVWADCRGTGRRNKLSDGSRIIISDVGNGREPAG